MEWTDSGRWALLRFLKLSMTAWIFVFEGGDGDGGGAGDGAGVVHIRQGKAPRVFCGEKVGVHDEVKAAATPELVSGTEVMVLFVVVLKQGGGGEEEGKATEKGGSRRREGWENGYHGDV